MATPAMDALAERYADRSVRSIFLYTREAHPAENYRHHERMDDKRRNAKAFQKAYRVKREIYLDSLDGQAHHAFGLLPNMTWIIGPGGIIHYKAAWTEAEHVERSLEYVLDHMGRRKQDGLVPFYSELQAWRPLDREGFRKGLERNGPQAVTDFFKRET